MKIAVAATPGIAIPTLEALLESKHSLDLVITQPDKPFGRGKQFKESEVATWAKVSSISTLKAASAAEVRQAVTGFDCVVTVGYGTLLPQEVLDIPKHGFLNLHFSLLPRWRGASPVQRAIEYGDKVTGVSVFKLDKGMDTGPIYLEEKLELPARPDALSLFRELSLIGAPAVLKALEMIEAEIQPHQQSAEGVTFAPKISKTDALIDWSRTVQEIDCQIRAFNAGPISWTLFRGEPLRILKANSVEIFDIEPGEISIQGSNVLVGASSGAIILEMVIPAGKKEMSALSWANGARFKSGEKLG